MPLPLGAGHGEGSATERGFCPLPKEGAKHPYTYRRWCGHNEPYAEIYPEAHMSDSPIITDTTPSPASRAPEGEYLTRHQAAEYIRDVLGRPMAFSTASKLAALGEFAAPAVWWGRRPLYTRDGLREWAKARTCTAEQRRARK